MFKRIANLSLLQTKLDQRLSKYTQLRFFNHIYDFWNSENDNFPTIPANYYIVDVIKIFLYWICYYKSYSDIEQMFSIPKTTLDRIILWVFKKIRNFSDEFVNPKTYEERLKFQKIIFIMKILKFVPY